MTPGRAVFPPVTQRDPPPNPLQSTDLQGAYKAWWPRTNVDAERNRLNPAWGAANFINGLGLLLHHSIAAWTVCNIFQGLYPLGRPMVHVCLPLVIQHWFCLVKYESMLTYSVVQIIAEVWWEIEIFTNMEVRCTPPSPTISAALHASAYRGWLIRLIPYLFWAEYQPQAWLRPRCKEYVVCHAHSALALRYCWTH